MNLTRVKKISILILIPTLACCCFAFISPNTVNDSIYGRWQYGTWATCPGWYTEYVSSLIGYNGTLVAGGFFTQMNGNQSVNNIASWNGSTWSSLGTGVGYTDSPVSRL